MLRVDVATDDVNWMRAQSKTIACHAVLITDKFADTIFHSGLRSKYSSSETTQVIVV